MNRKQRRQRQRRIDREHRLRAREDRYARQLDSDCAQVERDYDPFTGFSTPQPPTQWRRLSPSMVSGLVALLLWGVAFAAVTAVPGVHWENMVSYSAPLAAFTVLVVYWVHRRSR